MASAHVPFENRWTSDHQGWHWHCRLEREGVGNVRALYADHELHHPDQSILFEDIPIGFARDWLAYHAARKRHDKRMWHRTVAVLLTISAVAATIAAWQTLID